jgi:hypothetical protein
LKKAGINDSVKIHSIPLEKNSIILRLTNLADNGETKKISLRNIIEAMWKFSNTQELKYFTITEMNLTGNMKLSELRANKLTWRTKS